jgi:hypothetical protein
VGGGTSTGCPEEEVAVEVVEEEEAPLSFTNPDTWEDPFSLFDILYREKPLSAAAHTAAGCGNTMSRGIQGWV